jgi:hypothetical protein
VRSEVRIGRSRSDRVLTLYGNLLKTMDPSAWLDERIGLLATEKVLKELVLGLSLRATGGPIASIGCRLPRCFKRRALTQKNYYCENKSIAFDLAPFS